MFFSKLSTLAHFKRLPLAASLLLPLVLVNCTNANSSQSTIKGVAQEDPTMTDIQNSILFKNMLLGGRPTLDQYKYLSSSGYTTVIDLRSDSEEGVLEEHQLVQSLGMKSVSIPIGGKDDITKESASMLDKALANAHGPVVLHCASGNRVGALLAMRAFWIQGKSPLESLSIGKESGLTKLKPAIRDLLDLH